MSLKHYGVLKASPVDRRLGTGENSHYQILVVDDNDRYRLAVNVKSKQAPSELMYLIVETLPASHHRAPGSLGAGMACPGPSKPAGGVALDYIRANPFLFDDMTPLPFAIPGPDNDLNEKIDCIVQRAMAAEDSWLYAFGEPWSDNKRDKIFGFSPGRGVHDIHMNQGNGRAASSMMTGSGKMSGWMSWFPSQQQWVAIFLRFQSQAIHTDDRTGHAIISEPSGPPADRIPITHTTTIWPPTDEVPDGLVRLRAGRR